MVTSHVVHIGVAVDVLVGGFGYLERIQVQRLDLPETTALNFHKYLIISRHRNWGICFEEDVYIFSRILNPDCQLVSWDGSHSFLSSPERECGLFWGKKRYYICCFFYFLPQRIYLSLFKLC